VSKGEYTFVSADVITITIGASIRHFSFICEKYIIQAITSPMKSNIGTYFWDIRVT
jgi:hypothetical protein